MSGWRLTLTHRGAGLIDAAELVPDQMSSLSKDALASQSLRVGSRLRSLGTLFDIDGDIDGDTLTIDAASPKLWRLGAHMKSARLVVNGSVGDLAGASMAGGTLIINGDAGSFVGAQQSGGRIEINGNAGDFVAAATPGQRYGMRGGAIVINGSCGHRTADRLRRGSVLVSGDCGDFAASRVVAGTIVIAGGCGHSAAIGMRRGTLVLGADSGFSATDNHALPGYASSAPMSATFLSLLIKSIDDLFGVNSWRSHADINNVSRWVGDRRVDGRAEILCL